jgi:hypothetical protein
MQIAENEGEPETNYSLVGSRRFETLSATHTSKLVYRVVNVKFCLGNLGICLSKWQTEMIEAYNRRELCKNVHILFQRCLHY